MNEAVGSSFLSSWGDRRGRGRAPVCAEERTRNSGTNRRSGRSRPPAVRGKEREVGDRIAQLADEISDKGQRVDPGRKEHGRREEIADRGGDPSRAQDAGGGTGAPRSRPGPADLTPDPVGIDQATYCPTCRLLFAREKKFCRICGQSLAEAPSPSPVASCSVCDLSYAFPALTCVHCQEMSSPCPFRPPRKLPKPPRQPGRWNFPRRRLPTGRRPFPPSHPPFSLRLFHPRGIQPRRLPRP